MAALEKPKVHWHKTSLYLDEALYADLRNKALAENISMQDVIRNSLRLGLQYDLDTLVSEGKTKEQVFDEAVNKAVADKLPTIAAAVYEMAAKKTKKSTEAA